MVFERHTGHPLSARRRPGKHALTRIVPQLLRLVPYRWAELSQRGFSSFRHRARTWSQLLPPVTDESVRRLLRREGLHARLM